MRDRLSGPEHRETRKVLRVLGLILVAIGGLFMIVGFVDFFGAFGGHGMPTKFWCFFVGAPLLGLGTFCLKLGYLGAVTRYVAGEVAPVGKDTLNYMARGTRGSIEEIAEAVGEGLREAGDPERAESVRCRRCSTENDADARFCKSCGEPLARPKPCESCGELNDPDAAYCDSCGTKLA